MKCFFKLHWNQPEICSVFELFGLQKMQELWRLFFEQIYFLNSRYFENTAAPGWCACAKIKLALPSETMSWCFSACHMLLFWRDCLAFPNARPMVLIIAVALVAETNMPLDCSEDKKKKNCPKKSIVNSWAPASWINSTILIFYHKQMSIKMHYCLFNLYLLN